MLNERVWTGKVISWIEEIISKGQTIFQDATNDEGIKLDLGPTKYPDILLFIDKYSGIVFNGWELKFPDTPADDSKLLKNALEKAKKLESNSIITWNGSKAFIWGIKDANYNFKSLTIIKEYPEEDFIKSRNDLAIRKNYLSNEPKLKVRLKEILHDLELLYQEGTLKEAINISNSFIIAIKNTHDIVVPQFTQEIIELKNFNPKFRMDFETWKIYENTTLQILKHSSRRKDNILEEEVLAKFTFYNLIGRILFYLTLAENLSGKIDKIKITNTSKLEYNLLKYFKMAVKVDYQAVFKYYFTDVLEYNALIRNSLFKLIKVFDQYDFKILPTEVIGTILENLIPKEEKQKFGQYFTPEILANLVTFPAIKSKNDAIFDPTCGTGTFLISAYNILKYFGNTIHSKLLNQIWGNDISHFPAILSVINIYKQKVDETYNFPRIFRDDFFNIEVGKKTEFPDPRDMNKQIELSIPQFESIVSNFPFVQQEDIPNDKFNNFFRVIFENKQKAFLKDNNFKINERSDYFTYCIYNSIRFIKKNGYISAITSNAWLGKEYGFQFKKFLLDNFSIKYIVKSNAEHWFSDSKVSTIYSVFQNNVSSKPTKFVTLNFKLEKYFDSEDINEQLKQIENLYTDIDLCEDKKNINWNIDKNFSNVYHKLDDSISVSIVSKEKLKNSLISKENWDTYFLCDDFFGFVEKFSVKAYPNIYKSFRGERTGWNNMFLIPIDKIESTEIEEKFLLHYIKSPSELNKIYFGNFYSFYIFVCDKSFEELKSNYPGTVKWISKFRNVKNKNGTKTIQESCSNHKPFWYSLNPKIAQIVTAINPYERFFFTYSSKPFMVDQRLIAFNINKNLDVELIAALFNSIITFLSIELRGTARNLGVLDLNADYFKDMKLLNPFLLSPLEIKKIKTVFQSLKNRKIEVFSEEVKLKDRIIFDETILECFKIDKSILPNLYRIMSTLIKDRIEMMNR